MAISVTRHTACMKNVLRIRNKVPEDNGQLCKPAERRRIPRRSWGKESSQKKAAGSSPTRPNHKGSARDGSAGNMAVQKPR